MNVRGTLSIIGLYEFDDSLFSGMRLPSGVDIDTLLGEILTECAQLETIFPNWSFLHNAIIRWSSTRVSAWERMNRALNEEYNALHNFDRHEDWSETGRTENTLTGSNTVRSFVNGFNEEASRDRSEAGGSNHGIGSATNSHTGHLYGNIGVTKSQEMIADELGIRKQDIYRIIVDEFKERFCIMVY